ncbi:MAG: tetratricopeptide repeat protein [Acidobacteria bacterium]|nr:tetratricopeptide repeat protein [Acidobacteriota bacterium]
MPAGDSLVRVDAGARFDLRALVVCGATALLAGGLYLNALDNPFVYDDYHTVVANTSIQRVTNIRGIVLHDITRPIVNVSYAIDRAVWGTRPLGFHVTNVLVHMLNVVLLFRLAWQLVGHRARQPLIVAGAAAALFAVHPMMTEAVGYISGRSEVLCTTWFLFALLAGRRWIAGGGGRWAALTVVLWCAALATKETAAMFPFVFLALDWIALGRVPERQRRFMELHLPLMAVAFGAGIVRLIVLRFEYPGSVSIHWRYVLLELDVLRRYVWLLVRPVGQTLFHEVTPVNGLFEPRALFAIAAVALMVAIAWRLRRAAQLASFGIIWFLLALVPSAVLAVLDQGEPMAEHRVYLASGGLFLAAGAGVGRLDAWLAEASSRTRWLAGAAMAMVVVSFSAQTMLRNSVWADPVALWQESVDLAPAHYRPRLLLGEALKDAGHREEAIEQYKTAIGLRPTELDGYLKLGVCLAEMGRIEEARQSFRQAMAIDPTNVTARRALALLEKIGPTS